MEEMGDKIYSKNTLQWLTEDNMRLQQFDLVRSSGDFPKFQSFSNQIQETQQR